MATLGRSKAEWERSTVAVRLQRSLYHRSVRKHSESERLRFDLTETLLRPPYDLYVLRLYHIYTTYAVRDNSTIQVCHVVLITLHLRPDCAHTTTISSSGNANWHCHIKDMKSLINFNATMETQDQVHEVMLIQSLAQIHNLNDHGMVLLLRDLDLDRPVTGCDSGWIGRTDISIFLFCIRNRIRGSSFCPYLYLSTTPTSCGRFWWLNCVVSETRYNR